VSAAQVSDQLDEEILMVLTATVAAFMGKTARIRHARLIGTGAYASPWVQQGRVYVQGSHNLGALQRG
jgi:methylmalonyl-CoA carboxyltransferase large subunit